MNQETILEQYEFLTTKYFRKLQTEFNCNAADAEDAFHDALTALIIELHNQTEINNIEAYFVTIARNKLRAILKKTQREIPTAPQANAHSADVDMEDYMVGQASSDQQAAFQTALPPPDEIAFYEELKVETARAMLEQKETHRKILVLAYDDTHDWTDAEIAEQLGITVGTMKVRRSEALMALRKTLEKRGFGYFKEVQYGDRRPERKFFRI
ncbi:MAG: hypothetical protein RLZZ292_2830 [Bacteroidota bacterium]|jgi:RNA polymerase sigma factor (sigma-70 family)